MSHRANSVSRVLSCSLLLFLPGDLTSLSDGVSTRNKPSRPQVDTLFIIATESKLEQTVAWHFSLKLLLSKYFIPETRNKTEMLTSQLPTPMPSSSLWTSTQSLPGDVADAAGPDTHTMRSWGQLPLAIS